MVEVEGELSSTTHRCFRGDIGKFVRARFTAFPNDWEDWYGIELLASPCRHLYLWLLYYAC